MAYFDKEKFATPDTLKCGRLHTFLPGDMPLLSEFQ